MGEQVPFGRRLPSTAMIINGVLWFLFFRFPNSTFSQKTVARIQLCLRVKSESEKC